MAEIINLHEDINDEDSRFNRFVDSMKGDLAKGMFIAYKNNGEVYVSCNVYEKPDQIVLLYNLESVLKDLINITRDGLIPEVDEDEVENEDD